ncbi:MAG: hypothetical protein Kow0029_31300 [Candidatus Rifleibacteriota bacterium]
MISSIERNRVLFLWLLCFQLLMGSYCYAQTTNNDLQQNVASDTSQQEEPAGISSASNKASPTEENSNAGYIQTPESQDLQEKIFIYNKKFCPPEKPITEISDFNLIRLVKAELIFRKDIDKYKKMIWVDGKVYEKKDKEKPEPDAKPNIIEGSAGKNLTGSFEAVCKQLEQKKTRGSTKGNKSPEKILKLKRRKITYRDKQNQLKEMEIYSPPRFPAKRKKILGKRGKTIKDFATSILLPKNEETNQNNTVFKDMPSADTWIGASDEQTQINK